MTKNVFISRDLDENSGFASQLQAAGWQVRGLSLVTLTALPFDEIPEVDWIFFASKNAVRFFFGQASDRENPTPDPSPKREGGRSADVVPSTSPLPFRGGVGGGVSPGDAEFSNKKASVYSTDITQWKYLKSFAREMRKQPTESENTMWQILRGNKMEGLKFRRQHAIDDYIVDFVNLDLRLIVEIDGSIHEIQPEYDKLRTEWLTVLGYKVIRFTNEQVLRNLSFVRRKLRDDIKRLKAQFGFFGQASDRENPTPDPSPEGEGGRSADVVPSTSPLPPRRRGVGGGVSPGEDGLAHKGVGRDSADVVPSSSPLPPQRRGVGGGVSLGEDGLAHIEEGGDNADVVPSTSPLPFRGGVGGGVSWAALGPATARELLRYTRRVDFTGSGDPVTTADAFRPLAQGKKVLFPAARHSQRSVPALLGDDITALHLVVYDNAPLPDPPRLEETVLVFTSPMNARAYFTRHPLLIHQRVVAIGQTTAATLTDLGITGVLVAEESTESALARTVLALG